jgi:hemerythrin-like metal-binding protein
MSELSWSEALALDLPVMDETHQEFVELLGAVAGAGDDGLLEAWATLVDHTDRHFSQEDLWMRQTGFASGNCHSIQHGVVLATLREGLALGRAGRLDVVRRQAHELALWFPRHAQSMDAALALHLRGVGLDLATGEIARPEQMPRDVIDGCGSGACSTAAAPVGAEPASR